MSDFAVKSRPQIHTELNDDVRHTLAGAKVDGPGDDLYDLNAAASGALSEAHAALAKAADESFDDTASLDALRKRHANKIGDPSPALPARLTLTITGTSGKTWTTSDILVSPDTAVRYAPIAGGTMPGAGTTTITVEALTGGQITALADGATLYWESPPAGIAATATTTGDPVGGTDAETVDEYRARVFDYCRRPVAGGTLHDFERWAFEVAGVGYASALRARRAEGTVDVAVLDFERENVSAGVLSDVQDALDAQRPAGCYESIAVSPVLTEVDVTRSLSLADGYGFSSFAAKTTGSGCTTTQLVLNDTSDLAEGDWIAVEISYLGRTLFQAREVDSVQDSTHVNLKTAYSAAPTNGVAARPGCPTYDALAASVQDYFKTLPAGGGVFVNEQCNRAILNNPEVERCASVLPAADVEAIVTEATVQALVLGDLILEAI